MKENLIILRALSFLLFMFIIFLGNQFTQNKEQISSKHIQSTKTTSLTQSPTHTTK